MTEKITAWQCIGCGRLEAPATCIGVCRDRRVALVDAGEHEAELGGLRAELERLHALVERLAHTSPRPGTWEACYRAFQAEALRLLASRAAATAA